MKSLLKIDLKYYFFNTHENIKKKKNNKSFTYFGIDLFFPRNAKYLLIFVCLTVLNYTCCVKTYIVNNSILTILTLSYSLLVKFLHCTLKTSDLIKFP